MPSLFKRRRSGCTKLLAQEVISVMAVPGTSIDGKEASAFSILDRAAQLDHQRRFTEATVCYEEGLQLLIDVIKASKVESKRNLLREKALQYMDRAETLKGTCKKQQQTPEVVVTAEDNEPTDYFQPSDSKTSSSTASNSNSRELKRHRVINIANDSIGYGYGKIFEDCLDIGVISVTVKDPYVRSIHQIYNFLRFCELLVKSCRNLRIIKLVTTLDTDGPKSNGLQGASLDDIRKSLLERNVDLEIEFSSTLHDREIRLNNGWIIKIGRGLDIYKPVNSKFAIGYCDFDLRRCHETTVDIYRSDDTKPA